MRAPTVVPVKALGQAALLFDPVIAGAQVHPFVFDRPPQPLNKDVVVAATATTSFSQPLATLQKSASNRQCAHMAVNRALTMRSLPRLTLSTAVFMLS